MPKFKSSHFAKCNDQEGMNISTCITDLKKFVSTNLILMETQCLFEKKHDLFEKISTIAKYQSDLQKVTNAKV